MIAYGIVALGIVLLVLIAGVVVITWIAVAIWDWLSGGSHKPPTRKL